MTTYVLGAGASVHAGYPLCSELWDKLIKWVTETQAPLSECRRAIDRVSTLNGPVLDIERVFTDIDLSQGAFRSLTDFEQRALSGKLRRCLGEYFKALSDSRRLSSLYSVLANRIREDDVVITFNYEASLENELIRLQKFRVRNGYGFEANWDETPTAVKVLKLHGSINWSGAICIRSAADSLGEQPFVNNVNSLLTGYPSRVLDITCPGREGVAELATLILPTYEKKFSIATSLGTEWVPFYESLWSQAHESAEKSERIVIIGYSMPQADHRSRDLLLRNPNKRAEIFVCCGSSNKAIKAQFRDKEFGQVYGAGSFADWAEVEFK